MSDDQDGCEWVSVTSVPAYPGSLRPKAIKRLCVCVCVRYTGNVASELNRYIVLPVSSFDFAPLMLLQSAVYAVSIRLLVCPFVKFC